MSIKLNVNDIVKVKLNDDGIQILQDEIDAFNRKHPHFNNGKGIQIKQPDAEGFYRFTLWEFAEKFGPTMGLGNEMVFTELLLEL